MFFLFVDGAAELDVFGLLRKVEGYALLDAVVELDAPPLGFCGGSEVRDCGAETEIGVALAGAD